MIRLKHEFGKTLGCAHHAGGIDGLVGRDQYERLDACFDSRTRRVHCADNIIVYAFEKVLFNNGHMLVGGRVVDSLDAEGLHHFGNPIFMVHRAQ